LSESSPDDDDVAPARPPAAIEEEEDVAAGGSDGDSIGDIDLDKLAAALRLAGSLPDDPSDE
jgi:hypothetical protein